MANFLPAYLDDITDGLLILDKGGSILDSNRAARQFAEIVPTILQQKSIQDLLVDWVLQAEEQAKTGAAFMAFIPAEAPHTFEARISAISSTHDDPARWLVTLHDVSSLARAESALAAERNLLRTLIENIPDAIYAKDLQGRKTLANPADLRNMGLTSETEALGKTDFEVFPAELAAKFNADDQLVLKDGRAVLDIDEPMDSIPGIPKRWLQTSKIPLRDKTGKVTGMVGISRDITARKRIEEQLAAEHKLLRTVIDNLPDAIYAKDIEGRKTLANRADLRNIGLSDESQVLGKTDSDVFPPDHVQQYWADEQAVLQTGKPLINREEELTNLSGEHLWILTSKLPLFNEAGQIIGLVGIGRDFTDRRKAEQALKEGESRLLAIIENSPTGILTTSANGIVTQVNQAYLRMTGAEEQADEIVGKLKLQEMESFRHAGIQDHWQRLVSQGTPFKVEASTHTTSGREVIISYSAVPLLDENGQRTSHLINAEDITNYSRAQEAAQTLRALAEARAQEAEMLHMAGAAVASSLKRDEIINLILDQLQRVIPYDSASIQIVRGDEAEIVGGRGYRGQPVAVGLRFPLKGNQPNAIVYKEERPVVLNNAADPQEEFTLPGYSYIASWMGVPLIIQGRVTGILTLDSTQPNYFNVQHLRLATAFADQVAIALENARLYAEAQRSITEQSILNEISRSISAKLDLNEFLQSIYQQINRFIMARNFFIVRYDSAADEWYFIFAQDEQDTTMDRRYKTRQGISGHIIQTRQSLLLNNQADYAAFSESSGRIFIGPQPKSWMGVPLIVSNEVIGAMATQNYEKENFYSQQDFSFFSTIATQIAVAFENANLFARLEEMATIDVLTGIFNRRHFFTEAEKEVERSIRYGKPLAVIMFDLDHFKKVNDTYGHASGDLVLKSVTQNCTQVLRKIDLFGRYGGEEFTIVLPETDAEHAWIAAQRLCNLVSGLRIPVQQDKVRITASFGVAVLDSECSSLQSLLSCADNALYVAKQNGRNQVRMYQRP